MRHELPMVSTNQRDYRYPVLEKFKFHAAHSLEYGPDTGSSSARMYIHVYTRECVYVCKRRYVYVFMPCVPVHLITTIGLTNLIDVHQLFEPRSKAV